MTDTEFWDRLDEQRGALRRRVETLEETVRECIKIFEHLASAGHYPEPLLGKGWQFALDALGGAETETKPSEPITEEWLRSVGFKWAQFDRQPTKQWLLWLGDVTAREPGEMWSFGGYEDLGIELAHRCHMGPKLEEVGWFCWLRSDASHRYHRFIHVRHLRFQHELIAMIEGITGQKWDPANHWYGSLVRPEQAARYRSEQDRLDKRLLQRAHPWTEHEKDPDRSRPLIEHVDAAIKGGLAK